MADKSDKAKAKKTPKAPALAQERHVLYSGPELPGRTWHDCAAIPDPKKRRFGGATQRHTIHIETDNGDASWERRGRGIGWLARGPVTYVVAVVTYGP